jgi:hypothetical protein
MIVARALGRGDTGGKGGPSLIHALDPRKELAVLEVCGNIFGMHLDQCLEMPVGIFQITRVGAFHRQAVAGKGVVRLSGDEPFKYFAACLLLWLGHG